MDFKKNWKRAASLYWSRWKNEHELAKVDRARRVSSDAEACRLRGENAFLTKEVKNLRMTLDQVKVERDRCSKDALDLRDQVKGAKELIDSLDDALSRSRDELKARLAHAEADAEQAVHNEAMTERQRIVAWIRSEFAKRCKDTNESFKELVVTLDIANSIERWDHEP